MQNNYTINDFEGPLDLLLHLVKSSKMNLAEINIKIIIEQYLKFIKEMESLNIDIASEYLVMASELIHLKSRMLINKTAEEDEIDNEFHIVDEDDLKRKIIEYEIYKNITKEFKNLENKRNEIYTREPSKLDEYIEKKEIKYGELSIDELVNAFQNLQQKLITRKPLNTKITHKEISIKDRISKIKEILKNEEKVEFIKLFEILTKEYVVVTFLAILEMSKNKEILIKQNSNFDPIIIERNHHE